MFSPASSGAPSTPASGLVEESSSGMFRTISSLPTKVSTISRNDGRCEVCGCLCEEKFKARYREGQIQKLVASAKCLKI